MKALIWFRSDLRVADNTALHAACGAADEVVAAFLVSGDQWREHEDAPVKVEFRRRSLIALRDRLEELRIPLLLLDAPRFADAPDALAACAEAHGCDALFYNREYEWNEAQRDRRVQRRFVRDGRAVSSFDDALVLPPGSVLTGAGSYYSKFTPYKRRWLSELDARGGAPVLPVPTPRATASASSSPIPESLGGFRAPASADHWPADEREAHARLVGFVSSGLSNYDQRRDLPALEGTSTLSPYLASGLLSPRQCLQAALSRPSGEGRETWISELVWREFYKHLLVGYPRLSKGRAFQAHYEDIPWSDDREAFDAWCVGRTGYPLVDAGMRQLQELGWMHNRVRMVVAMFLTKHLLLDWRWGESHFMRHLVDGDLAANNGGWQWSASTGTDAQPYFRVFNPWTQSARFDADGDYVRRYVPELAKVPNRALHDPDRLRAAVDRLGIDYPRPIVEHRVARERAIATFKAVREQVAAGA